MQLPLFLPPIFKLFDLPSDLYVSIFHSLNPLAFQRFFSSPLSSLTLTYSSFLSSSRAFSSHYLSSTICDWWGFCGVLMCFAIFSSPTDEKDSGELLHGFYFFFLSLVPLLMLPLFFLPVLGYFFLPRSRPRTPYMIYVPDFFSPRPSNRLAFKTTIP